jgi:hypothetical protein
MADDDGLLKPPESLRPVLRYEMPEDLLGWRPSAEEPQGAVRLLWEAIVTVRYRFGVVFGFMLVAGLAWLGPVLVIGLPSGYLLKGQPDWMKHLTFPLYWPVTLALMAGLGYAILLVVQELGPRTGEMFKPFRDRRLYLNVLVAGIPAYILAWAVGFGWACIRSRLPAVFRPADSFVGRLVPQALATVASLPFVFAALNVTVTRSPFGRSIRRGLRFAQREPWLLLGFGIIQILMSAGILFSMALFREERVWSPLSALVGCGMDTALRSVICGGLVLLVAVVGVVFHPLFYREFVWREREAGERDAP